MSLSVRSLRSHDKINIPRRMALAPSFAGRSSAKFSMNGLLSLPLIQKASADIGLTNAYHSAASSPLIHKAAFVFSMIKEDLGALADEAVSLGSAYPYFALGTAAFLAVSEAWMISHRHQSLSYQLKKVVDPKTSLKKRAALCRDSVYPDVRRMALEEHKDIPENVVVLLGKLDPDPKVRAMAIRHPNFPESALLDQISNGQAAKATAEVKNAVMERLGSGILSEEVWVRLLGHRDPDIRYFFLRKLQRENQNFSEETIRKLFNDQYPDVKLAVLKIEGIKIPEDVIRMAMKSNDMEVRRAAFSPHLDIPEDLLKEHVKDAWIIKDAAIGLMVLEHPKTPNQSIAEGLHEMHVISKVTGSESISTIISVLQKHSSQKALDILDCLEKIDPDLTKKIGNI